MMGRRWQPTRELATNRSHQAIEEEVQRMLAEAKAADAEEDAHYGPARRGDELPEGLEIWPESGGSRVSGYTWSQQA